MYFGMQLCFLRTIAQKTVKGVIYSINRFGNLLVKHCVDLEKIYSLLIDSSLILDFSEMYLQWKQLVPNMRSQPD